MDLILRMFLLLCFIMLATGPAKADESTPSVHAVGIPDFLLRACVHQAAHASDNAAWQAAKATCTAVIRRPGNSRRTQAIALSMRGMIESSLSDTKSAIDDLTRALTIVPNFPPPLFGLAATHLNNNENEKAVADATQLLAAGAGPFTAPAYITRGDAYNNLGQYNLGIDDFDQALKVDPTNAEAMNDRAWAMERQGHYDKALQGYNAALAVPSDMQDVIYGNRSETEMMLGQVQAARQDCAAEQKLSPASSGAYDCFGFIDLKTKVYAKAVEDYTAARAKAPTGDWELYPLGIALVALGQTKAGETDITTSEKAHPNTKSYYAGLGILPPAGF